MRSSNTSVWDLIFFTYFFNRTFMSQCRGSYQKTPVHVVFTVPILSHPKFNKRDSTPRRRVCCEGNKTIVTTTTPHTSQICLPIIILHRRKDFHDQRRFLHSLLIYCFFGISHSCSHFRVCRHTPYSCVLTDDRGHETCTSVLSFFGLTDGQVRLRMIRIFTYPSGRMTDHVGTSGRLFPPQGLCKSTWTRGGGRQQWVNLDLQRHTVNYGNGPRVEWNTTTRTSVGWGSPGERKDNSSYTVMKPGMIESESEVSVQWNTFTFHDFVSKGKKSTPITLWLLFWHTHREVSVLTGELP